jgi:hypothetical protein
MTVTERITAGRALLDQGKEKQACRELTDAIVDTRDAAQTEEIRHLADRGLSLSGFMGKGRWKELVRLCDARRSAIAA